MASRGAVMSPCRNIGTDPQRPDPPEAMTVRSHRLQFRIPSLALGYRARIWPARARAFASTLWISTNPCELTGFNPSLASIEESASL